MRPDPDPVFHFYADSDPASKRNSDPRVSGSATLVIPEIRSENFYFFIISIFLEINTRMSFVLIGIYEALP
jgi:hypothetical protein